MSKSSANKPERTDQFVRPRILNNETASIEHQPNQISVYMVAGGLTGLSELSISYPFDYIKTQLQLARNNDKVNGLNTVKDVVKATVGKRGVKGLYRGYSVAALLAAPRESFRFGVYESLKQYATDEEGNRKPTTFFLAGFGAGICEAAVFSTPMETVKITLVRDLLKDRQQYSGFFIKALLKIMADEGVKGLYRGLVPTVIKQGTNQGIRFYVVESLKLKYRSEDPTVKIAPPIVGLFGVLAGTASVIINNPIDVVKTRMQGYHYKNIMDCVKTVFMEEGYSAFYKGMKTRVMRVAIDGEVTFMLYDVYVNALREIFNEN